MFLLNISYLIDSTPCLQVFSSRRFAIFSDWFKVVHSQIIRLPRCYIVTHYIENNSSNLTLNVIDLSKVWTSFKHRQTIKGSLGYILTHSIQEVFRLYKVYIVCDSKYIVNERVYCVWLVADHISCKILFCFEN